LIGASPASAQLNEPSHLNLITFMHKGPTTVVQTDPDDLRISSDGVDLAHSRGFSVSLYSHPVENFEREPFLDASGGLTAVVSRI
jgi:hypothetical protein